MTYKNLSVWEAQTYDITTIDQNRIKKFKKVASLLKNKGLLLDVGCGNASLHELLPDRFVPYGFDITEHFIDEANKKNYFVHDACKEFPFSEFDSIICVELLEHVPSPYLVLENIFNALKVSGEAVISTPNGLYREFMFGRKDWKIPHSVYQYLTPTVLEGMIREIGGRVTYSDWRAKYRLGHIYIRFEK